MRLYVVECGETAYFARKYEAFEYARSIAKDSYHDISIDYVEITTTQANMLRILNGAGGYQQTLTTFTVKGRKKYGTD